MNEKELNNKLSDCYKKMTEMKCQISENLDDEWKLKTLTCTQIEYLKIIDNSEKITLSGLAKKVNNSKPTVTEMIKKFIKLECVYKEKCKLDARKSYLVLTEKGKRIARIEDYVLEDLMNMVKNKLSLDEIERLLELIEKIYK